MEPITGLCIVDRKGNCPPGYVLIDKTAENEDGDLWKDGIFRSKVTRYICCTKNVTAGQWNHIVTNVVLIGMKDSVPQGYTAIRETIDTKESALRKHVLCMKLLPKTSTNSGIVDLQLMRTDRYKAEQYTSVGAVNGINIVYKLACISISAPSRPPPPPPETETETVQRSSPPPIPNRPSFKGNRTAEKQEPLSAINGIAFKLHDRLMKSNAEGGDLDDLNIRVKSQSELDEIFNYDFTRERELTSRND